MRFTTTTATTHNNVNAQFQVTHATPVQPPGATFFFMYIYTYMSSPTESHDNILNKVCYDPAGYGSITSTFKEAFQIYETLTLNAIT